MKHAVKTLLVVFVALVPWLAQPAAAADEDPDAAAPRCVDLMRIDRVDIVDDQNLLFYMKDGTIYHNRMTHACPGLRREGTFMYSVPMRRLCNVDLITVLENHGFGFARGASCGLGDFKPISEEAASQMKEAAKKPAGRQR
jgi:hypothetical protein